MRPLILYHGPTCTDGWASAWCANRHFNGEADFIPVQHGDSPPDVKGRVVFILDFSYKREVLLRMAREAQSITLLDHHQSAEKELAGITAVAASMSAEAGPSLVVQFDMERSGARLTWDHFNPGRSVPWLIDVVQARDLWRFDTVDDSREISAALASYPFDFALWDRWAQDPTNWTRVMLANEGTAILRYQSQQVKHLCATAREVVYIDPVGDNSSTGPVTCSPQLGEFLRQQGKRHILHEILAVNTPVFISLVAGQLAKGRPFGACWFTDSKGRTIWSLRSDKDGLDVSEIAKRRGGGGHMRAAGFQVE